jgi:small subunit ribosomal protein S6
MLVLTPELPDNEYDKINLSIKDHIKSLGGEVTETDVWGRRTLSYEINKKKEGYYLINYFSLSPDELISLERSYQLNESIIRYNILRIDED